MELDLNHYAWRRVRGDITLIGTWLIDGERNRPCMVLIPTNGERHEATVPCIVPIDNAFVFDIPWSHEQMDRDRRDAEKQGMLANFDPATHYRGHPYLAWKTVREFASMLRFSDHDIRTQKRIGELIKDHIGDLFHIPPYTAPDKGQVIGDLTVTDRASGATREIEIKDV
ncbi:hypothetical protein [Oricola sp.]|uniref:hypothetical protein n=1 Tax=Oricola sp. TaxID=1979950 RepID=UPI003BA99C4D